MSTVKGAKGHMENYLQHVELKDYKSIKELKINFMPGLNIIIGKNGSGKTNFVNCLDDILKFDYDKQLNTESDIVIFLNNDRLQMKASYGDEIADFNQLFKGFYSVSPSHLFNFSLNNNEIIGTDLDELRAILVEKDLFFSSTIVSHGNPYSDTPFITIPTNISVVNNGKVSSDIFKNENSNTVFLNAFFWNLYVFSVRIAQPQLTSKTSIHITKEEILTFSEGYFIYLNENLKGYSNIGRVRLNPDFKIVNDLSDRIVLSNFYLEFNTDGRWLSFNFLSDGTKRLFYIISEISDYYIEVKKDESGEDTHVILLEEPELGIHPHQLHKLMLFIKEQSRDKQIILTTHSPQLLDILGPTDLDRILICKYDEQKGTVLNHLNKTQIKRAQKYMKNEGFLSEYWRFSDLEPVS